MTLNLVRNKIKVSALPMPNIGSCCAYAAKTWRASYISHIQPKTQGSGSSSLTKGMISPISFLANLLEQNHESSAQRLLFVPSRQNEGCVAIAIAQHLGLNEWVCAVSCEEKAEGINFMTVSVYARAMPFLSNLDNHLGFSTNRLCQREWQNK